MADSVCVTAAGLPLVKPGREPSPASYRYGDCPTGTVIAQAEESL